MGRYLVTTVTRGYAKKRRKEIIKEFQEIIPSVDEDWEWISIQLFSCLVGNAWVKPASDFDFRKFISFFEKGFDDFEPAIESKENKKMLLWYFESLRIDVKRDRNGLTRKNKKEIIKFIKICVKHDLPIIYSY